ncbi:hypothetical protein [Rhizobium laguerreae]|uniref:hypothetical protein n=1 Tax=Rhizobium laguerreae TaxID=1076926 RepID=UPI001C90117D|nr:hypothetical protein [Rhizobium laguerreae]MBY3434823.1 hypothetical protein [Rhizobium laguerreae]MBY3448966.1 hypothetical protein [Rhizobium laguerreae]MBY3456740.1 hypothetical protein [Rhizobium laguerreae]
MKQYTTRIDCEVAGQWRVAGLPFAMTDEQAAELIAPRGNVVTLWAPAAAEKEKPNGRLGRNKRRNRPAPK